MHSQGMKKEGLVQQQCGLAQTWASCVILEIWFYFPCLQFPTSNIRKLDKTVLPAQFQDLLMTSVPFIPMHRCLGFPLGSGNFQVSTVSVLVVPGYQLAGTHWTCQMTKSHLPGLLVRAVMWLMRVTCQRPSVL